MRFALNFASIQEFLPNTTPADRVARPFIRSSRRQVHGRSPERDACDFNLSVYHSRRLTSPSFLPVFISYLDYWLFGRKHYAVLFLWSYFVFICYFLFLWFRFSFSFISFSYLRFCSSVSVLDCLNRYLLISFPVLLFFYLSVCVCLFLSNLVCLFLNLSVSVYLSLCHSPLLLILVYLYLCMLFFIYLQYWLQTTHSSYNNTIPATYNIATRQHYTKLFSPPPQLMPLQHREQRQETQLHIQHHHETNPRLTTPLIHTKKKQTHKSDAARLGGEESQADARRGEGAVVSEF